ncbi:hypothetical protein I4U23_031485 [Adineta vaga]|nr:hypothetical protein I4U23_031485 [Adineta vaga]
MVLCGIFGIICAIIFIIIVVFHHPFHTTAIMLSFNSAIAGLIINITCTSQAIYQLTSDGNDKLCSFRGFLLHAATGLLHQALCVQALNRLFVVVFATQRHLQSKQVIIFITIVQWLISITFAIPALVTGRIVYQSGSRICQASLNDLIIFLYLTMFIYCCPLLIIISVYIRILYFAKQRPFSINTGYNIPDQRRKRRELRFIHRILIIVVVMSFMSFPYVALFLRAQFFPTAESIPYAQRFGFIPLSFGYGLWMLLNLIFTDEVRKYLVDKIQVLLIRSNHVRVQPHTTNG